MPPIAIAAALFAALLHASWNAALKGSADRITDNALLACGWIVLGGAIMAVGGWPPPDVYPYLLGSVIVHSAYWAALNKGYEMGDLSHVYTLSRGCSPLLIALGAAVFARETPGAAEAMGIALVSLGVLAVGASPRAPLKVTGWALMIAACIAGYSLIDALGARAAGRAEAYVGAMFVLDAMPILAFCIWRRGPARLIAAARRDWLRGVTAGVISAGGFCIVLWAQTFAPIAQVSALRETSVVFAALIAWFFLKERLGARRWIGAAIVALGAMLIGFG